MSCIKGNNSIQSRRQQPNQELCAHSIQIVANFSTFLPVSLHVCLSPLSISPVIYASVSFLTSFFSVSLSLSVFICLSFSVSAYLTHPRCLGQSVLLCLYVSLSVTIYVPVCPPIRLSDSLVDSLLAITYKNLYIT